MLLRTFLVEPNLDKAVVCFACKLLVGPTWALALWLKLANSQSTPRHQCAIGVHSHGIPDYRNLLPDPQPGARAGPAL
jgi:hypothetical protein